MTKGETPAIWLPFSCFLVYAVALLLCISRLSLWLDELIEITQTKVFSLSVITRKVTVNPGGVPLGYYIQACSLKLFGVSAFSARLPSLIFGAGCCALVLILSKDLKLRYPLVAAAIFALFPIQVRYSLEARPYSQALFFTCLATLFFARGLAQSQIRSSRLFFSTLLALYSQPYSVLPIAAQVGDGWLNFRGSSRRKELLRASLAVAAALACFLPWVLYAHHQWRASIEETVPSSGISPQSFLLVFKDLLGSGYAGTGLLLILCAIGIRSSLAREAKRLLIVSVLAPIVMVFCADAIAGYFLAIRQLLFVTPFVAMLGAAGFEKLASMPRFRSVAWILLAAVLTVQAVGVIGWFRRPREDWARATQALQANHGRYTCIVFDPPEVAQYYSIFDPQLPAASCRPDQWAKASGVALATTSSPDVSKKRKAEERLEGYGFKRRGEIFESPNVSVFSSP